ncbi:hypothetical protein POM88_005145 [Heracleum sosnowskyi]|uniref:Uncharacterized protein n=1 Tax=Heracleum sosnowskyi TaxID=360622 RepID=A0AAD8N8C7_9APIA|nr:hypothetical protein POM88_005145 [Heracleum sosnowskyi]
MVKHKERRRHKHERANTQYSSTQYSSSVIKDLLMAQPLFVQTPMGMMEVGLKFGTKLVSSLEKIFKEKSYKVGNLYDCQQLVNDIEGELDGAKVAFKDIKYGQVLEVKYGNEVCVLYDKDAEERVQGLRKQPLTELNIFF